MPTSDTRYNSRIRPICGLLSYVVVITLFTPPVRRAAAGPAVLTTGKVANVTTVAVNAQADPPRRNGELLVRFKAEVTERGKDDIVSSRGARRRGRLRGESRIEKLELQPGQDPAAAAEQWRGQPGVEVAEPNFLVKHDEVTPNDLRFSEQWALRNAGQSGGAVGSDVRAAAAWQETTGSPSTVIAVVDSGIDFSHPDLAGNRWMNPAEVADNGRDDDRDGYADDVSGWDWVADVGVIRDEQGHGTAVAGIIAAEGNNASGISGVMWRASLMSLRVLDSAGTGDIASAVEAIDYAAAHGAQVVNCSWGTDAYSEFLKEAVERAGRRGVVVVVSAGNSGRDIDAQPYYPASFGLSNLISVASSDSFDNLAPFSNRGVSNVMVAAPGTEILTTQFGGDYRWVGGTSASAPLVSGIAGLIKTVRPVANPKAVRDAIDGGARRVDILAGKVSSGGVADAAGALAALHGNPYGGTGNGHGNGQGNGRGTSGPYVPPALSHDNDRGRAKGKKGLIVTPPATVKGAPGANLPDLEQSRRVRTLPSVAAPSTPIQANLRCADCDPTSGGGGDDIEPSDPYFGTGRTRPLNDTGDPGVNLGSRNFNWSLPIVSLPGRTGFDLSFTLYYNSLVWTKQNWSVQYNADHGTPAPGFQLGMPRLQARYYDFDASVYAYIMITPSGGRVEMRQVGTSNVYEAADSTYTQLTFEGSTPVVRTTNGTQYVFGTEAAGGAEWRCTQVRDRNGNFISASYDAGTGHLLSATDTLGRVVNFNYDANGNLSTITQNWGGVTHTYASFVYGSVTMYPNFPGTAVFGPKDGASQTVLSYVVFPNNESHHFDYNTYGQVYRIRRKAPDGHELSHTRYNISDVDLGGAAQSDCPRFTARYDYAQDWNNGAEAVTTYSLIENSSWQNPETLQTETGTLAQQTMPDGTTYKQYSHSSGWDAGLPRLEEVWASEDGVSVKKKWTSIWWTQDDTSLPYPLNPRPYETNVYDGVNRKRTTIEYNQGYGLPTHIREWGGPNMQTTLRMRATVYNLDPAYTGRRIIGIPFRREVWGNDGVQSRYDYYYDQGGPTYFEDTPAPATRHDRASYGPGFLTGRANLSYVMRYNVEDPHNWTIAHVTRYRYNSAGSLLAVTDHDGHAKTISYADTFSDGNNARNTFAYPTTFTAADGTISTAQYNYDFGALTRTHAPTSGTGAGTTYADVVTSYDAFGRPGRVERFVGQTSKGYKTYVYEDNYNYVHTYETVAGLSQADELHSWQVFDGAGRVRAAASDHPGSVGGYSGQHFVYDVTGRMVQQSNPTEMNGGWGSAGDDSAWVYTAQEYDWMGRPTQTTNPDGTTRLLAYGGCGCTGGEVTTAQDEHGRQKRYTMDVLGRVTKAEELNWNGTVYSTTQYAYNMRDQLTGINQQGQVRTLDYDGYGRLWRRTTPEQGATTYVFNADDTIASATDARGVKTVYGYDSRHRVTSVSYDLSGVLPGQNVAATPKVAFEYDAAGNRTSMTERDAGDSVVGATAYHYDSLSRMDWEERSAPGLGAYRLSYEYTPAGALKKITYPWQFGGASVSYAYDKAGRLNAVTGAGYANVSTYAHSFTYRAFGAVKGMSYANGRTLAASYDGRLRPTKWDVPGLLGFNYNYDHLNERTGRVSYAQSIYDPSLDRSYEYDHVGRLIISHTGAEARAATAQGPWGIMDGPYSQGYEYDKWGNMTHRYGWGGEVQGGGAGQTSHTYYAYATGADGAVNNRRADSGFTYDNAGNLTFDGGQHFTYDATGQQTASDWTNLQQSYDGQGLRVRKSDAGTNPVYYLRSSVLGGRVVAELLWVSVSWQWMRGYVYAGSQLLAVQQGGVFFVHENPVTKSKRVTDMGGSVQSAVELDPYGADTGRSSNSAFQPRKFTSYQRDYNGSDEAMFRRYNRWHSRFDQPDPYDGSYNFYNPQTLNRYAYVNGDPVSLIDPTGLCTFNINLTDTTGLLPHQIEAVKREITEIFEAADQKVVFGNARGASAPGLSFNLSVVNKFPAAAHRNAGTNLNKMGTVMGYTMVNRRGRPVNSGYVAQFYIGQPHGRSYAYPFEIGRVGAHEAGHFFLNIAHGEGLEGGLMSDMTDANQLADMDNDAPFRFTEEQAERLSGLCPPEQPKLVGWGPGGGDGVGGDIGAFARYPSWWHSMWAFVAFVDSLPVGESEPTSRY